MTRMSPQGDREVTASMIDVVRHGPIALVTLRCPPANAMNLELTEEIATVFQHLGQDKSVRSLVLTGQGPSFCAGVELKSVPHFDEARQSRMVDALNRAFYAVYSCAVPVWPRSMATPLRAGLCWRCAVTGVSR